jgi:hypothetical protein
MTPAPPLDPNGAVDDQVVEIVADRGYRPQAIIARAGVPVRLVFHRRDDDDCMDRIVFSSPHLDRRLVRGKATTIVLPPQPPGLIRFTCGMGRYHGQIELRSEAYDPLASVRAAVAEGLRRGWQLMHRPVPSTVEQEAMAIAPAMAPQRDRELGDSARRVRAIDAGDKT